MRLFHHGCIEAGQAFQKEFLRYPQFSADSLLGVQMRLHAHGCRIMGEIITLLMNGYADGALARWRTLHEIAVTSLMLAKFGQPAAEEYIRHGIVRSVAGMEEYQKTAHLMKREPYSENEMKSARGLRDELLSEFGLHLKGQNGWAKKFISNCRFKDMESAVGLAHWRNDYALASQDVHATYREMRTLLGMSEMKADGLLCGPSDAGMTDPAHRAALSLSMITATFITTYAGNNRSPIEYGVSAVFMMLLKSLADDIGERFLEIEKKR